MVNLTLLNIGTGKDILLKILLNLSQKKLVLKGEIIWDNTNLMAPKNFKY